MAPASGWNGKGKLSKSGGVVSGVMDLSKSSYINEGDAIGTLPEGFRPAMNTTAIMSSTIEGNSGYAYVDIGADGRMTLVMIIWKPGVSPAPKGVAGCFAFPAA